MKKSEAKKLRASVKYRHKTMINGEILQWFFPCEILEEYSQSYKIRLLTENGYIQVGKKELIVRKKHVYLPK